MDIVSKLPFKLKLIQEFPTYSEVDAVNFCLDDKMIWTDGFSTLEVEENEDIELLFDSDDKNARLYLDALDIMPVDDMNVQEDEFGRLYRMVSSEKFALYKSNAGYDALRVDSFKISIFCNDEWYYGVFDVIPKPMSKEEWKMMRDDLEKEIRGLSQDIVRRNTGIGNRHDDNIPLEVLHDFLVIKKYSNRVMMALMDISENPRYEIKTEYTNVLTSKSEKYKYDSQTMRRYANRSGSEPTLKVPVKVTNYDIQDNKLLKNMLNEYDCKIGQFIRMINDAENYSETHSVGDTQQYISSWNNSLKEFKCTAIKLRKISAIMKAQEWYTSVGKLSEPYIPHSFILDTRYNTIYQMHTEFNKKNMNIQLNPEFSYTWKQSSCLYEMWCFLKVCHLCFEEYEIDSSDWKFDFEERVMFPFIAEGTTVEFKNEKVKLQVVYDKCLSLESTFSNHEEPLYIAKHHSQYRNHNRPDILVNVYDREFDMYLGSVVLECKYRKLFSFWDENSSRSSRGQFEAYYNNARSIELLGGLGEKLDMRPVTKVIVLSPDDFAGGKEQKDFNIVTKTFKATVDKKYDESLKNTLIYEISKIEERLDVLKMFFN